jgi:hypothetical protein
MRLRPTQVIAVGSFVVSLACARASEPLPPAEEVLLVVNRDDATLQIIRVNALSSSLTVALGGSAPAPTGVSARDGWALVPLGPDDGVAVVNLRTATTTQVIPLPTGSGATGSAIVDDSIGYVANPNLNSVTRVNYLTGDTASVAVGVFPQGVSFTRGKVFVLNGNLVGGTPAGPSWVSVIDPLTNRLATGVDSILMPGPGNAAFAAVGQDGVLYVMNGGPVDSATPGRLTLVDPVGRSELANFGGFGNAPGEIAANTGGDLLYVSSSSEGLMVFDVLDRQVLRGAGNGVPVPGNTGVAVDSHDRVYALESGTCGGGTPGKVHVLRPNLSEIRTVAAGHCASGSLVTEIPPLQ